MVVDNLYKTNSYTQSVDNPVHNLLILGESFNKLLYFRLFLVFITYFMNKWIE